MSTEKKKNHSGAYFQGRVLFSGKNVSKQAYVYTLREREHEYECKGGEYRPAQNLPAVCGCCEREHAEPSFLWTERENRPYCKSGNKPCLKAHTVTRNLIKPDLLQVFKTVSYTTPKCSWILHVLFISMYSSVRLHFYTLVHKNSPENVHFWDTGWKRRRRGTGNESCARVMLFHCVNLLPHPFQLPCKHEYTRIPQSHTSYSLLMTSSSSSDYINVYKTLTAIPFCTNDELTSYEFTCWQSSLLVFSSIYGKKIKISSSKLVPACYESVNLPGDVRDLQW